MENGTCKGFIANHCGAWYSPAGKFYLLPNSHENFVNENPELFNVPPEISGDDLVAFALEKGWIRIRGRGGSVNIEICEGDLYQSNLGKAAKYLIQEYGEDENAIADVDIYKPNERKYFSYRCTLKELIADINNIYLDKNNNFIYSDYLPWRMVRVDRIHTGLPVDILVDDGVGCESEKCSRRLLFPRSKDRSKISPDLAAMTIEDKPQVIGEHELSDEEIDQIKEFIIKNKKAINDLAVDSDHTKFFEKIKW